MVRARYLPVLDLLALVRCGGEAMSLQGLLQDSVTVADEAQRLIDRVIDVIGANWAVSVLVALGILLVALGKGANAFTQVGQTLSNLVHFRRTSALNSLSRSGIEYSQSEFVNRVALGDHETVSKFIAAGMGVNTPDATGRMTLVEGVKAGHFSVISSLLESGANPARQDSEGLTAMDAAANKGSEEIAFLLLRAGADLNVTTPFAFDLWCHASNAGRLEDIELLLTRGLDPDLAKCNGVSGAALAAGAGHLDAMKTILLRSKNVSSHLEPALVAAASIGQLEVMRWLMGEQIPKEIRAGPATEALRAAATAWHLEPTQREEAVSFLLGVGADPEGAPKMVKTMVNSDLEHREAALIVKAAQMGLTEVVIRLAAAGSNINQTDHLKVTPLMYAAANVDASTVDALLMAGAEVDLQQYLGMTALMLAVRHFSFPLKKHDEARRLEIVDRLLRAGADPKIRDRDGQTALDIAQTEGHQRIVNRLARAAREDEVAE
jgi:serine/threonine-protein phosphatase 6 regulatory ankyrin repeat subunit B